MNEERLLAYLAETLEELSIWVYDGSGYIPISTITKNKNGMIILGNKKLVAPHEV